MKFIPYIFYSLMKCPGRGIKSETLRIYETVTFNYDFRKHRIIISVSKEWLPSTYILCKFSI